MTGLWGSWLGLFQSLLVQMIIPTRVYIYMGLVMFGADLCLS